MSDFIAVTMPGKIGDALSAVPAARALAARHGCKADFWTSRLVGPAADLLAAQDFVRAVYVDPDYRPLSSDCGVQPWRMPTPESLSGAYAAVYHLGFRETPAVPLPEYCCTLYGLPQQPNRWDLPPGYRGRPVPQCDFVALAPRGYNAFTDVFRDFVHRCWARVVEVGAPGEAVAADLGALDRTSVGFLEMAWVISKCRWFVGLLSAPYVVATGFPCQKIVPIHGWDPRHAVRTGDHHYPQVARAEDLLGYILP